MRRSRAKSARSGSRRVELKIVPTHPRCRLHDDATIELPEGNSHRSKESNKAYAAAIEQAHRRSSRFSTVAMPRKQKSGTGCTQHFRQLGLSPLSPQELLSSAFRPELERVLATRKSLPQVDHVGLGATGAILVCVCVPAFFWLSAACCSVFCCLGQARPKLCRIESASSPALAY